MLKGVALAQILTILSLNDSNYVDLTAKIIAGAFPLRRSICYYAESDSDRAVVDDVLKRHAIPVITLNAGNDQIAEPYECDGYIIIADDHRRIKRILRRRVRKINRIVVVFTRAPPASFNDRFYSNATHSNGLDLIVVGGYRASDRNRLLTITSIRDNRTLLRNWNVSRDNDSDNVRADRFRLTEWRPNFHASHRFRASVFACPPFVHLEGARVVDGTEYRILKSVRPELPIAFLAHVDDRNGTGLWSLNLRDVLDDRSDLAMCSQWQISVSAVDGLDPSLPYMQSCSTFLVPKPRLLPQSTYVFQPFQLRLWLFVAGSTQLFAFLLYAIARVYLAAGDGGSARYAAFGVSLMHSTRIMTMGSAPMPPARCGHLRQTIFYGSLTSLLLSTAYSAGFASSLTSPRYREPIDSLEDMVEQRIGWGAKEVDTLAVYNTTTNRFLRVVNRRFRLEANDAVRNRRIRRHDYAFPVNSLPNHYVTDTETLDAYGRTNMKVLTECVGLYYLVFGLKRNSPYKNLIDKHVNRCNEHGLIDYWNGLMQTSTYMENFFETYVASDNKFKPLTVERIQGIFILLAIGHVVAFGTFLLEVFCSKNHTRNYIVHLKFKK